MSLERITTEREKPPLSPLEPEKTGPRSAEVLHLNVLHCSIGITFEII